jgi:hypothetical protein
VYIRIEKKQQWHSYSATRTLFNSHKKPPNSYTFHKFGHTQIQARVAVCINTKLKLCAVGHEDKENFLHPNARRNEFAARPCFNVAARPENRFDGHGNRAVTSTFYRRKSTFAKGSDEPDAQHVKPRDRRKARDTYNRRRATLPSSDDDGAARDDEALQQSERSSRHDSGTTRCCKAQKVSEPAAVG